jgi:cell division protein FtsN
MICELMILIGLGQGDTTALSQTFAPEHVAQAGIYSSWEEVLSAREAANIAGFGSISKQLEDGTYTLNYVFKGTKATASSQLERLNVVLGEELELYVPITKSLPKETASISGNKDESKKQGIAINVSANFEKIPLEPTTPNPASVSEQEIDVDVPTPPNPTATLLSDDQPDQQIGNELQEQTHQESTFSSKAETETTTETDDNLELSPTKAVAVKDPKSSDKETVQDNENGAEEVKSELASKPTESITSKSNSDPLYAIIFGSFKSKRNAIRKRDALINEGYEATIFNHDNYYRVGIGYKEYPSQPLRNFTKQGMQHWLLRND